MKPLPYDIEYDAIEIECPYTGDVTYQRFGSSPDPFKDRPFREFWWVVKWKLSSPWRSMGLEITTLKQPLTLWGKP